MSRIEARAEDVLTLAAALGLLAVLGTKSLMAIRLSENNYWDFAFILLPVALLVLGASIRYAFRPLGAPGVLEMSARTGGIGSAMERTCTGGRSCSWSPAGLSRPSVGRKTFWPGNPNDIANPPSHFIGPFQSLTSNGIRGSGGRPPYACGLRTSCSTYIT